VIAAVGSTLLSQRSEGYVSLVTRCYGWPGLWMSVGGGAIARITIITIMSTSTSLSRRDE